MPKRRSTVHDLASLRLHPDGTKVSSREINVQLKKGRYATRDHRGNWIAHDAGGVGRVKLRRAAVKEPEETHEDELDEDEEQEAGPSRLSVEKGKGRADDDEEQEESADEGEGSSKDYRAIQRKAFRDNLAFLTAPASGPSASVNAEASAPDDIHTPSTAPVEPIFAQPSSDLLKCIHYFASTYYTEMGQLRDSTREYRREKKRRKLARLQASVAGKKKAMKVKLQNANEDEEDSASDSESSSSSSEDEEDDEPETKTKAKKGQSQGKRKRSLRRQAAYGSTDMYKICDGSALMAIGMLVQQHVADVLSTRIPDGWEEAMGQHHQDPVVALAAAKGKKRLKDDDDVESLDRSVESEDEEPEPERFSPAADSDDDAEYIPD